MGGANYPTRALHGTGPVGENVRMSTATFVPLLATCAAALALWIHLRWPSLAPESPLRTFVHAAIALGLLQLVPDSGESVALAFVVVFGAALPAFVYCFLAAIWLVRMMQGAAWLPR